MADNDDQAAYLSLRKELFGKRHSIDNALTMIVIYVVLDFASDAIDHRGHAFVTWRWWFGKATYYASMLVLFSLLHLMFRRAAFVTTEAAVLRTLAIAAIAAKDDSLYHANDAEFAKFNGDPVPDPKTRTRIRPRAKPAPGGTRKTAAPE
jgi:hypothetical protein